MKNLKYYLITITIFCVTNEIKSKEENFSLEEYLLSNSLAEEKKEISQIFNEIYNKSPVTYINFEKEQETKIITQNNIKKDLEKLFQNLKINSIFDANCKDYSYMSDITLPNDCLYTGNDFSQNLIEENKKKYSKKSLNSESIEKKFINFTSIDLTKEIPPTVDLIFCKDFFNHLPFKDIKTIIENFKKSKSKYLLTTTHQNKFNKDCVAGNSRKVNLQLPPFNFSQPRELIYDKFNEKFLALWKLDDIETEKIKNPEETVTIAILAKDKAHTLPIYLKCIENQTWPKSKTYLYIRTNNNNDNTAEILREWIKKVKDDYLEIYFNDADVCEKVQDYKPHDWHIGIKLKVLAQIRDKSIEWANERFSHYFVADCDNFFIPETIETLVKSKKPIVGPLIYLTNLNEINDIVRGNFHVCFKENGAWYDYCDSYKKIVNREIKDLVQVKIVHCTYLIQREFLPYMLYDDGSWRYEFYVFSENARKKNIPQYIDTRKIYGKQTLADNKEGLEKEPWLSEFQKN